jgi:hypothetical protein
MCRLSDGREVMLDEAVPITSIALSADSRFLLTSLQSHELRLWLLGDLADACAPDALDVFRDADKDPMDEMVGVAQRAT